MSTEKIEAKIVSPFDGKYIDTVIKHSEAEAFTMLDKAHKLFTDKSKWLKPHERVAILNKLADLISAEVEECAMLIAKEGGKPLADARVEANRAVDGIKLAAKELMHVKKGQEIPMGYTKAAENRLAFTIYEPIGVVLAISAFNHPLNLIVHQVIPAVAVGCPVLVKPASKTPLSCMKLVNLLYKAGLPEDWCKVVLCDNTVAEKIVADSRIGFFTFIGSSQIGWYLRNKLAEGTRFSFEHGGVAPVIVDKNIDDMDEVINSVIKGGYYHAGQVCISVQRVYVHENMVDEFAKKFADKVSKLKVGDPTLAETEVGPLISTKEVDRVDTWVKEAVNEGAKLLVGGEKITDTTYKATVLLNPKDTSKVSAMEVFGPVVSIYSYKTLEEAVTRSNAPNLPFQSAVFSNNINNIMYLTHNLEAAAVIVNDHSAFRVDWMPFAGRKSAGYGIGGIGYAMHEMTNHKMIVIKNNNIIN
ncbi:aldehyde dehydrogenase family protein [Rickettsiales bacterium LUAb2]